MRHAFFAALLLALPAGCSSPGELSPAEVEAIKGEVTTALHDAYDISKPDAERRMLSLYPTTGRVISANTGRATTTRDSIATAVGEFWRYVGVNMREPRWAWRDMYIDVLAHDAAVVTATYLIPHRNPNNQPHTLGGAMTVVFQKRDGRWTIIQEHLSDLPQATANTMTAPAQHQHH